MAVNTANPPNSATTILILAVLAFLLLLPMILTSVRTRKVLGIAAMLLTISAVAVGAFGFTFGAFSGAILMPLAIACWFAALLCGLACYMDYSADRRHREMTWRLLNNDVRGLGTARDYGLKEIPRR